jgi:hypothetical protein
MTSRTKNRIPHQEVKELKLNSCLPNFGKLLKIICSQFHQHYTRAFFVQIFQQSQYITRKTTFVRKICTYSVDEIDTWQLIFKVIWEREAGVR